MTVFCYKCSLFLIAWLTLYLPEEIGISASVNFLRDVSVLCVGNLLLSQRCCLSHRLLEPMRRTLNLWNLRQYWRHRDIIHRGSLAINLDTFKGGYTLSVMCDTLTEHIFVKLEIKGDTHEIFMQYGP